MHVGDYLASLSLLTRSVKQVIELRAFEMVAIFFALSRNAVIISLIFFDATDQSLPPRTISNGEFTLLRISN